MPDLIDGIPSGKECINCKKVLFYHWGNQKLLDHDKLHGKFTGWIELRRKNPIRNYKGLQSLESGSGKQ